MQGKTFFLIAFILIAAMPVSYARSGQLPLLAVSQTQKGYVGSLAQLHLEVSPGTGRVFIDTFPLTRLDTQVSTRFANQIACRQTNVNCQLYDFFYTIRADTSIIGGPSAGAAVSALTIATLENLRVEGRTSITGSINSGGVVGPVGGLKEKIDAASRVGIRKVLIPSGTAFYRREDNTSIDLIEYGAEKGVEVIEVSDLDEIMFELTGKPLRELPDLEISPEYEKIMKGLAERLCQRSKELRLEYELLGLDEDSFIERAVNLSSRGEDAFENGLYYSSASFCFGANTNYRQFLEKSKNMALNELLEMSESLNEEIIEFDSMLPFKYETMTDLQTYAVVRERVIEALRYVELGIEEAEEGNLNNSAASLGFAAERFYSAKAWSEFFENEGEKIDFNREVMRSSCITKILEAEERYQYVSIFLPERTSHIKDDIDLAQADLENEDYELCLFKASKAKAEADVILSTIGVEEEYVSELLENKLNIVKKNIVETSSKGHFPIVGYSYYEYAESLRDYDKYSALLYAEYALELSNLDIYFPTEKEKIDFRHSIGPYFAFAYIFLMGIMTGLLIAAVIFRKKKKGRRSGKIVIRINDK